MGHVTEGDETNNILGPITIKVLPTTAKKRGPLIRKPPTAKNNFPTILKGEQNNKLIEDENATIKPMEKEASELEAELKALEKGGGG